MEITEYRELISNLKGVEDAIHSVDLRLTRLEEIIILSTDTRKDHENRLRALEMWVYRVVPLVAIVLEVTRRYLG